MKDLAGGRGRVRSIPRTAGASERLNEGPRRRARSAATARPATTARRRLNEGPRRRARSGAQSPSRAGTSLLASMKDLAGGRGRDLPALRRLTCSRLNEGPRRRARSVASMCSRRTADA